MTEPSRPSPEALLRAAAREARGKLKIFLGAAPGVGKTFEMLREGAERLRAGTDVVVAVVETHGRAETQALTTPFEIVPRHMIAYNGHALEEMDLDAVLARAPALALVDEYAHSNVEGSRHAKRWQDVAELLTAGIDVYTTLNVQHVESLNDVVASFTRVRVRETVPDSVFDGAEIEVVDLPPDELIERLKQGKVYVPAEATRALGHFFSKPNLSALREMALRRAALSVDQAMLEHLDANAVAGMYAGGERVLVAVSELPGADGLVRAAKRLADALRAPWQAIHIATPRAEGFDEAARHRIAAALRLAASLGATIATVPAESVVMGLREQLRDARATQLVLGKSVRSRWFALRHGSIVDTMLREHDGIAVHVIPATGGQHGVRRRFDIAQSWGPLWLYAVVAGAVALTTLIAEVAQPLIGVGGTDLVYLLPVILVSGRFGLRPGVATGVVSGLAYNFFFLPPIYTFTVTDPQSVLMLGVLIGIATFTANLTGRLRIRATLGNRSATENAAVAGFGQALARASDWDSTAATVADEIARLFDVPALVLREVDGVLVRAASAPAASASFGPVDQAAAEWSWTRAEPAGAGTATLGAADWQFHPLATTLGVLAVVGIARSESGDVVRPDRAVLLATLLGQAALAHERLTLETQVREVTMLKERDRLRAALLSSIGHDLRTPLTAVGAAVDAMARDCPTSPALPIARAEVARLRRFLDNLVAMVRLDAGGIALAVSPIDLTDAVAGAVHDLRDLLRTNRIDLQVPANLPFVRADATLLHHILINLLANAALHGGPDKPIVIAGRRTPSEILLAIVDDGPGMPAELDGRAFETFVQGVDADRRDGSGLGLAIAKGFADAMGVGLSASNGAEGGAVLTLRFAEAVVRGG